MTSTRHSAVTFSRAFLVLAILACGPCTAVAQDLAPPADGTRRVGPFRVTPTLELRDIGVDTNVYNDGLREPIKDLVFTFAPAFLASVGGRRANASVRSATDVVYFMRQTRERSVNEDLTLTAHVQMRRFVPFVEGKYLNTRQRVSGEIDARARRIEVQGGVGARLIVTPKISAQIKVDRWRNTFDPRAVFDAQALSRELNREADTVEASIRYILSPIVTLIGSREQSSIHFLEDATRHTDRVQTQVAAEFNPRARIAGFVRIGHQRFEPRNSAIPTFTGMIGNASVSYRLRATTELNVAVERRTDFSYLPFEPYYLRQNQGLIIRQQLPRQWFFEFGGARATHHYRSLAVLPDAAASSAPATPDVTDPTTATTRERRERLLNGTLAVGHQLNRRMRVTTRLVYQGRRSNLARRQYNGIRFATTITYAF